MGIINVKFEFNVIDVMTKNYKFNLKHMNVLYNVFICLFGEH